MDVTIALQQAVKGFPHGTAALAARLGLQVTSLLHKVSPTYPSAHASPEEALSIMEVTGDHGAFFVQARALRYVVLPEPDSTTAQRGTAVLVRAVREFGELASAASAALEDGNITANELARLQREAGEAQAAIQALMRIATALHDAGRPADAAI